MIQIDHAREAGQSVAEDLRLRGQTAPALVRNADVIEAAHWLDDRIGGMFEIPVGGDGDQ